MERKTLYLEDLNGHGIERTFSAITDSLKETGGVVAYRRLNNGPNDPGGLGGVKLQAVVQCVYSADANVFALKVKAEKDWETRATCSPGLEGMITAGLIREIFEAEGRDA
jgi:hypothetical protein